jgi:hypothetical protein
MRLLYLLVPTPFIDCGKCSELKPGSKRKKRNPFPSILLIILLILPGFAFSQTEISILRDTMTMVHARTWPHATTKRRALVLSDGHLIETFESLKLGIGSLPDGDFNYITKPSNNVDPQLKFNTTRDELVVAEIKKKGSKKSGYKYEIVCEGNYVIQIDEALAKGEIIP